MTTVVNNPDKGDSGMGFALGIVLLIAFVIILIIFGLPALRGTAQPTDTGSDIQVDVPDQVDVNVNEGGQ